MNVYKWNAENWLYVVSTKTNNNWSNFYDRKYVKLAMWHAASSFYIISLRL